MNYKIEKLGSLSWELKFLKKKNTGEMIFGNSLAHLILFVWWKPGLTEYDCSTTLIGEKEQTPATFWSH